MDPAQIKTEARKQMHFNQPQEAVRLLQEMLPYYGQDAEAHALLGAALSQSGNDSGSIPHFEQAVRLDPGRAAFHYNLGMAYEKAGQLQWALEGYRRAMEVDANFAQASAAYYRLAPKIGVLPQPQAPGVMGQQYTQPSQYSPQQQYAPQQYGAPQQQYAPQQYGAPQYSSRQYGIPPVPNFGQPALGGPHRWADAPQIVKSARFLNFFFFTIMVIGTLAMALTGFSGTTNDDPISPVVMLVLFVLFGALYLWLGIAHKNATKAAWTVQLIMAILGVLGFPLGTIIHIYLLCYWFRPETKAWYGV